ncbi:MAG TPA: efflux transporter outer membrane subunit, partial [Thermodesulfobacteriota bacterium]|nr:efflux transporter outer membrane subunit [Thermodesulfobacteriota bacterium]
MKRIATFCTLALALAGCMVGPDYRRPPAEAPPSFRYEAKEVADTANTQWWKQFDDPVLDQLIAEALANNKSVKIAASNVALAQGVLMTTRSGLYPQAGYSGGAVRHRYSLNSGGLVPRQNPLDAFSLLGSASWEIDLWGRIRRLSEAAQANLLGTEEARRGVILSLVAEVASAYIQLRGLDEQLLIARRTLKAYEQSVRLFELQFKYGQVSRMTVEQARSQYETAAATIPQVQNQIATTENAISILLGRDPGPIPRGRTIAELTVPAVPAGLPSQLLERRPDILQAEQNLVAANAQIGAAKSLYYPSISLTGTLGLLSTDLYNLFQGSSGVWSFAGNFTGPIFTAGNIRGQVIQAEAGQQAALWAYRQAIQSAFADVENA